MENSHKMTIRFDDATMHLLKKVARLNGMTFSQTVRRILIWTMFIFHENGKGIEDIPLLKSGLDKDDKQLLHQVYVLYSRSASNLNQSTHALNQLKNLSWLDSEHSELMGKLNRIYYDLVKVNYNFDRYQDILHVLVSKYNSNNK